MASLADDYRILRPLRRGEFTEVLLGVAPSGRQVAIKRLVGPAASDPALIRALADEARIAARIDHPSVVGLLDADLEAAPPYLVFEYVDGKDLFELEAARPPLELVLHIVTEVAHALAAVHQAVDDEGRPLGVVHRDVTPGNILVGANGVVRLTDFGIALGRDRLDRTAVGVAKGTLDYMAPEQLSGGVVDARADLFSLGCVLCRAATGHSPLEGLDPASRAAGSRNLPGALPADVLAIVERATRKRAADRYPDAGALAGATFKAAVARLDTSGPLALEAWMRRQEPPAAAPGAPRARMQALFDQRVLLEVAVPVEAAEDAEPKTEVLQSSVVADDEASTLAPGAERVTTLDDNIRRALPRVYDSGSLDPETDGMVLRPLITGSILDERYRLGTEQSVGRFGTSYLGEDLLERRPVSITVLERMAPSNAEALLERLRSLARLSLPGLVRILAVGSTDAASWIVFDSATASTLAAVRTDLEGAGLRRALGLGRQIAEALSALHASGQLHLELSPSSVLLDGEGQLSLSVPGFGGSIPEVRAFAAPEVALHGPATPRADLWSLGALLYYLFVGRAPFLGEPAEVEAQKREGRLELPASLAGVGGLVRALLDPDPARRPVAAAEVARALAAAELPRPEATKEDRRATPAMNTLPEHPVVPGGRSALRWALLGGVALLVVLGLAWIMFGSAPG
ncbi:MAG: protein kinase [Myxococcota bacterium]